MGSNTRNAYNLKNGANKLEEINIAKDLIDVMVENISLLGGGSGGGGQLLGNNLVRGVQYMSQETGEELTLGIDTNPLNGFAVDSLTILDGGSLTISNGSVFKVI
jgi:hypothetical protein